MQKHTISPEKLQAYKERASELVSQMTLQEKVYQMLHNTPAIPRLGIPAYNWWNEALHGVSRSGTATVFPQAIGLAATFDEELAEEVADATATEARAKFNVQLAYGDTDIYKGITFFTPNVNIFRDPRWGRGHETYGEDPYLTSRMGVSFINGLQGHDGEYFKTSACAKHYAAHSGPEDIRHSFNAVVSKRDLAETYLPAFKTCVQEANVESVMGAYNRINGEPGNGSKTLLQDILRDEWGFEGYVVSDCWAIKDFHEFHHITKNATESVALALNCGCDMNCGNLYVLLTQAVEQGLVKEETINTSVIRLLTTRMKLGLFDPPEKVPFNKIPYSAVDSDEMRELNLRASSQCLTLLKNQGNLLPLDKSKYKTIAVVGPNANNRKVLVGNYEGTASRYVTILEGIQDYLEGTGVRVLYSEGCHLYKDKVLELGKRNDRISEVKAVCADADLVIACIGLDPGLEGEEGDEGNQFASGDKPDLNLPGLQEELLKTVCESGKPVVAISLSGSAIALDYADENIPAVIQGWYPGALGGKAMANLLFGDACPSGKLPVTFYRGDEKLPDFIDYSMKNRTYRYMKNPALYPFGYGLTYSDYEITEVSPSSDKLTEDGVNISLKIKNTGSKELLETLQAYVHYENGDALTPGAQLKAIRKVKLIPGESKDVTISLPCEAFALADDNGEFKVNSGEYSVYVGCSQPDERSFELTGKRPVKVMLTK